MKKKIFLLLAVFSLAALTGGIYLAYTSERNFSDFNNIISLHHIENLREHLLLNINKVEIDLYSQKTVHPESRLAVENDLGDLEKSIHGCYSCHHVPIVQERLDDLNQQIEQYKSTVSMVLALPLTTSGLRKTHQVNAHVIGDSLMGKVETMVVTTSEKLRERTEESLRRAHGMKRLSVVLIAAGPLIMIIFAFTVIRGVAAPVRILLHATRTLKVGNLEHRITGLKDEFGELALAFNDMAGYLQATMRAIEESEKRYRLLFESAVDAIFILDAEGPRPGRILEANHAAASMHGYSVEELTGMTMQNLDGPDGAAAVPGRIDCILRGEWLKFEIDHRRKDGTIFPVEVTCGLLETGGHKFVLALDRDISERKRAEKELKRTERIRVAGELATGLAHEIKNPLAGIKVSMEALSEESYLSADDREVLGKVIGEIKRIEYLMQGLLSFAHPPKPHLLSTDVNTVLESVASLVLVESARSRDKAHAILLVRELDEDLPDIMADPMQLKQIFMNLMLNAVDAMPGGGTLTIRTAFDREKDQARIELSDTGRGIDAAALGKIFNPFFTTKSKGTGLGLSITRRLVEEHGGRIRVENNRENGVTCRIILPLKQTTGALTV
jgi:two-component system sensor histidine kinase AtoS